MNIYVFENETSTVSNELNSLSTNLAHLAQFKISSDEISGFNIDEESIEGLLIVITKKNLSDNSFIKKLSTFHEKFGILEVRILLLEDIDRKTLSEKISINFSDVDVFEYFKDSLTRATLLNVFQSFNKSNEASNKKVSSSIEHLIKTSHIDEGQLLERDWKTEYLPIGSSFGSEVISYDSKVQNNLNLHKPLQQLFIAKKGKKSNVVFTEDENNVLITLKKILQRGFTPPLDNISEESILKSEKINYSENSFPGDLTPEVEKKYLISDEMLPAIWASTLKYNPRFNSKNWGETMVFNSNEELTFFKLFDKKPEIQRWLHPQYPLQELLTNPSEIGSVTSEDQRRVDILFAPPWCDPFVVEILGEQHFDVDSGEDPLNPESSINFQNRKKLIRIDVLGIPAKEISSGTGENLDKVLSRINSSIENKKEDKTVIKLVKKLWETSALNASLYESIYDGFLNSSQKEWVVGINKKKSELYGVPMFLKLLSSLSYLWDVEEFAPQKFIITNFDGEVLKAWEKSSKNLFDYDLITINEKKDFQVAINLEIEKSYLDHFTALDKKIKDKNVILARALSLPVNLRDTRPEASTHPVLKEGDDDNLRECLITMLNFIFRKEHFREGQFEAINKILKNQDLLLLLPTGAGKSLVYQMISFILPGRVLVIDPIIALMNDQEDNLRLNGIDRVVAINSETYKTTEDMKIIMNSVEQGDNLIMLVAPERLLIPEFNQSLKSLFDGNIPLSLIVFDEAHCISEWGHDFRTSYLGIGERIKKLCNIYEFNPPILAMTGTASQPVVRDIIVESDFKEEQGTKNVIKADSYKRDELNFSIELTSPSEKKRILKSILKKKIPNYFRIRPEELFAKSLKEKEDYLGIIFVKTRPEMLRLYNDFQFDPEISRAGIGMYFGSSGPGKNWPTGELGDWKEYKKRITKEFKKGEKRILISTIAFGMGIDIPNIRYVVHYGISNSLEAWYQEAGRAGRNRLPSYVASVFSEEDLEGSNHLLVGEEKELRKRHSNLSNQWSDDVKVNLSFHWLSWKGILDELYLVKRLLNEIGQDNLDRKFRGNYEFKTSNTWQVGETSIPVEQLIYRLHIVGLVEDWQKNYGVRESTYFLTLKDRDTFLKFEQFRHWLKRRSPRDQNAIVETLVQLNNSEIKQQYFDEFSSLVKLNLNIDLDQEYSEIYSDLDNFSSLLLSSVNIALHEIYTSVESARRRKVREIVEFSRNKVSNTEIHNGFEQYFTDGPAADLFRQLYDSQIYEITPWLESYESLTVEQRIDSRGDIVRYADESSSYLAIEWLLILNSIESGNIENLKSELFQALQNSDKELTEINKYDKIFNLWKKCFESSSDLELRGILLNESCEYFLNLSDEVIKKEYLSLSYDYIVKYLSKEDEIDISNIFSLKIFNLNLDLINTLMKEKMYV